MTVKKETYHHGRLREELINLGLEALEHSGAEALSLRALAEEAGVSKTAPYRHFKDKEAFLGALADEGYRLLYETLQASVNRPNTRHGETPISAMGHAYMEFSVTRPALYRLMNSPIICRLPPEYLSWARKTLVLLAETLSSFTDDSHRATTDKRRRKEQGPAFSHSPAQGAQPILPNLDTTVAVWAYIHGIVMIRIDGLYPKDLPEPDWNRLMQFMPELHNSTMVPTT